MMNQTIRSPQQQNLAQVINNIKTNGGSLRNLQNFRSKRMEKAQQQHLFNATGDQVVVRAPPIQNGLYFSNIIQANNNNGGGGGGQSQRYPAQQQQP